MTLDSWLLAAAVSSSIAALLDVLGVNIYELKKLRLARQQKKHSRGRSYTRRPLVSVIVATSNHADSVADCLTSLIKSDYRKLEIIVADNGSSDNTKRITRRLMANNPKQQIRLYAGRQPVRASTCLSRAFKKYAKGELIMLIEGSQEVDSQAIGLAVERFKAEPGLDLLNVNYKMRQTYKTAALLQEFSLLLSNRAQKVAATFKYDRYEFGRDAIFFNREALAVCLQQKQRRRIIEALNSGYAGEVLIYCRPLSVYAFAAQIYKTRLNRMKTWRVRAYNELFPADPSWAALIGIIYRLALGLSTLAAPALLTYFTYLAINLHQPGFLVASWVALALFLLFAIWEDEHFKLSRKLRYAALMPITYGWFYVMSFVQYLVLLSSWRVAVVRKN